MRAVVQEFGSIVVTTYSSSNVILVPVAQQEMRTFADLSQNTLPSRRGLALGWAQRTTSIKGIDQAVALSVFFFFFLHFVRSLEA